MRKIGNFIFISIITIFVLMSFNLVIVSANSIVTTEAIVRGREVAITGEIQNSTGSNQVFLLVGSTENIIYVDQTTTDTLGKFSFKFLLPKNLSKGSYSYKIGTDADTPLHTESFTYRGEIQTKEFIDATFNLIIEGYTPKIEGAIICGKDKSVTISILNTTDNTIIANDTIYAVNGLCDVSYQLPSLIQAKNYTLSVQCSEGEKLLASANLSLSSSIALISVTGEIETADEVIMYAEIKSLDRLIDANTNFSGRESISVTLPNIAANAEYELSIKGYEKYYFDEENIDFTIIDDINDTSNVIVSASNIKSFNDRTFKINYDPTEVEVINMWGMYIDEQVGTGRRGDVEILSYTPGEIVFSIHKDIPEGKVWTGVLNIFKFKLCDNGLEGAVITIGEGEN